MNDADRIGHVAVDLAFAEDPNRAAIRWSDLSAAEAQALESVLNTGISKDRLELVRVTYGRTALLAARYSDAANDFYAEYLLENSEPVFKLDD